MIVENVRLIINEKMKDAFDSHDFIKEFIWSYPSDYGKILEHFNNVALAHAQISKFLSDNADVLHIKKTGEDGTDNIFGHDRKCAQWIKIK